MNINLDGLSSLSNLANIATAVVAFYFGMTALIRPYKQRCALEKYISSNPEAHTIRQLMATLCLTEEQVLKAAYGSHKVTRIVADNANTGATDVLLIRLKKSN